MHQLSIAKSLMPFGTRNELQGKLRDSFQKILWFYGFKLERKDGEIKVGISLPGS